jgi:hypothetical protein
MTSGFWIFETQFVIFGTRQALTTKFTICKFHAQNFRFARS